MENAYGITNNYNSGYGNSNQIITGSSTGASAKALDISNSGAMYSGTVNGTAQTLGQNNLGQFDAGSINSANVNGTSYGSDLQTNTGGTDWGMNGLGGAALGLGQLGMSYLNYADQKKTAELQRELLGQQKDNNAYEMQRAKNNSASLKTAFGTN